MLEELEKLGVASGTLVVVASDHGESLGEHGEHTHGIFVYDATLRVPLIFSGPGVSASRVRGGPVGLVDVLPTIAARFGLALPQGVFGRDLLSQETGVGLLYAESYLPRDFYNWSPLHALRSSQWKLIDAPEAELYDLERDPKETRNLRAQKPRTARQMTIRLEGILSRDSKESSFDPSGELLAELRSLGYMGGSLPSRPKPDRAQQLPDPKRLIGIVGQLDEAIGFFGTERFKEAETRLQRILALDPENFLAAHYLAETLFRLSKDREAIDAYRQVMEKGRDTPSYRLRLGVLNERIGSYRAASDEFRMAVTLNPEAAREVLERSLELLKKGETEGALL
ncbi:MAG: sulfatase-like hydrolase/transferase, partial [Acidobacteria bacterium]|nr:sulfatase-like hydrolase/transferase [Acidobacteriota bacterium]